MHFTYLLILLACVVGTLPLEVLLQAGVYARWPRLLIALAPVVLIFGAWDLLAISQGTWSYAHRYLVGVFLPGRLPLEELLFFLVVPTCAVLTFEAVRTRRPQWFSSR